MQNLSHAIETFSKDLKAKFNFYDALQHNELVSAHQYFADFFRQLNSFYSSSMTTHSAFNLALKILSERFLDSFYLHLLHTGTNVPQVKLPNVIQDLVRELDKSIREQMPCYAVKKFDEVLAPVCCESNQFSHGDIHQSSQTYKVKIARGHFSTVFWHYRHLCIVAGRGHLKLLNLLLAGL